MVNCRAFQTKQNFHYNNVIIKNKECYNIYILLPPININKPPPNARGFTIHFIHLFLCKAFLQGVCEGFRGANNPQKPVTTINKSSPFSGLSGRPEGVDNQHSLKSIENIQLSDRY